MRERIGQAVMALVALYTFGVAWYALACKPCESCLKPTIRHARLIGYGRRVRVCRQCRADMKYRGMIRPRGQPRRPAPSTQHKGRRK